MLPRTMRFLAAAAAFVVVADAKFNRGEGADYFKSTTPCDLWKPEVRHPLAARAASPCLSWRAMTTESGAAVRLIRNTMVGGYCIYCL